MSAKAYKNKVTCSFCSKKTHGHRTARDTISCPWCGKVFEDVDYDIDLFPDEERLSKFCFESEEL